MSGTRRKPGRLAPFVDGYRVWLLAAGYTPQTVRWMLRDLSRLGRWMDAEDVQIRALSVTRVESWLAARRAADGYRVPTVRALRAVLSYLGEVGVMGEEEPPALSAVEALVDGHRRWLIADRGLAAMTVLRYETFARRFLTARLTPTDELGVTGLDGAVVARFLLGECDRVCLGSAKGRVAELRSLLRFLHVRGFTVRSLAESVPGDAEWRETTIPPTMPPAASHCARLRLAPREAAAPNPQPAHFSTGRWCTFRFLKLAHFSAPVDMDLARAGGQHRR